MQINANSLSLQAVNFISMNVFTTKHALQKAISAVREVNSTLGFVPTMGGLHQGHISLIKRSLKECNKTIVSIFVNPTQFNNKNDFKKYPRNNKNDLKILKKLNIDPALASSVFVTTITDVIGFLSFLGLGSFYFLN